MTASPTITDNAREGRLELHDGEAVGVLEYHRKGDRLHVVHTEVPDELEGRGYGSRLARAAMEKAEREGLKVVPTCPFVVTWLERHPEYARLVARTG